MITRGSGSANLAAGRDGFSGVIDALMSRARPVFLCTLITIRDATPLLFDPFFRRMAVTIIFSLAFATLLALVVVPPLYAAFFSIRSDETG